MSSGLRFDGKVVIITGAGNGLGRSYALDIARRGGQVVVNDLGGSTDGKGSSDAAAARVVEEIRAAGGTAVPSFDSVATPEGGQAITDAALKAFGRVDAVIANAGILRDRSFAKLSPEELDAILAVHLRGTFFTVQPAFRWMKDNGGGNIVTTTSASGLYGNFGQSNYAAAKMGIAGMTRVVALEGAKFNVKANCLGPTASTRLTQGAGMAAASEDPDADPMAPARVAALAVALAHSSCPANGEIFNAAGGWYSRAVIAYTGGWLAGRGEYTADAVAAHWAQIRDTADLSVPFDAMAFGADIGKKTGLPG
ncbi:MAG: SDR family NAD(P)-dependent oxidoreductase [Gammaproteobacteria bacterium]